MPEPLSPTDADLLAAFRGGDARAFEALVRRYQRAVLTIALRFARDQDDAEDLAQRAFINAAERAGGWRGGSFKSWLFRIVVNLCKNYLRDTARFDRSEEAHEREAPPSDADAPYRAPQKPQLASAPLSRRAMSRSSSVARVASARTTRSREQRQENRGRISSSRSTGPIPRAPASSRASASASPPAPADSTR